MSVLVAIPSALRIVEESWSQTDPRIVQRSVFTGHSPELHLGPAARWTCEAEIVTQTADDLLPVRAFLAWMSQPGAFCALPAFTGDFQPLPAGAAATAAVDGAGQLGRTIIIDGLTPSQTNLQAGQVLSIDQTLIDRQLFVVRDPVVADGSGRATVLLNQPLRLAPPNNAAVFLLQPTVLMRLSNPMQFRNVLANLHNLPTLTFEERF